LGLKVQQVWFHNYAFKDKKHSGLVPNFETSS
jgi:hypothetical protein